METLQKFENIIENTENLSQQEKKLLNDCVSRYVNGRSDYFFCGDCFKCGYVDNGAIISCGGSSCGRAYCEKCLNKRNEICKCGVDLSE
jgi:hypothetical protein